MPLPFAKNLILAQLAPKDRDVISRDGRLVSFSANEVMYQVDDRIDTAWFPISGMISIISDLKDGSDVEVGASGYEGMIGFEGYLGAPASLRKQIAQIKGEAITVPIQTSKNVFKSGSGLAPFMAFLHAHITEAAQIAACNHAHLAEERLARWLLSCRDRVRTEEFSLTHYFLSEMLGTRRSTVSIAAAKFQDEGLIRYRRGIIQILNLKGLQKKACGCYATIRAQQLS